MSSPSLPSRTTSGGRFSPTGKCGKLKCCRPTRHKSLPPWCSAPRKRSTNVSSRWQVAGSSSMTSKSSLPQPGQKVRVEMFESAMSNSRFLAGFWFPKTTSLRLSNGRFRPLNGSSSVLTRNLEAKWRPSRNDASRKNAVHARCFGARYGWATAFGQSLVRVNRMSFRGSPALGMVVAAGMITLDLNPRPDLKCRHDSRWGSARILWGTT